MDKNLLRSLRSLDEYELRRLMIVLQGLLLDSEGPRFPAPAEPPRARVHYRRQHVRCGKEGCTRCPHGPYWYAYWREDGRLRSRYVGKELPEGVEV